MRIIKIARKMEAWRFGTHDLPEDVAPWVMPLANGFAVLVSPRAGTAHGPGTRCGIVIEPGWWIIRAETGCLYAVPNKEFHAKYTILEG